MSLLDAALEYAAQGWRVINIWPGQKNPVGSQWETRATRNPEEIEKWWGGNAKYGIGGLTGPDIVVVDIDVKDGTPGEESLARIIEQFGPMPPTRTHRTPSGGWHYIFRRPGDWSIKAAAPIHPEYPGVDLRTDNTIIVLPPSQTPSGAYELVDGTDPAEAPAWIEQIYNAPRMVVKGEAGSGRRPTPVGERNQRLASLAGRLRREGQDEQRIFDRLWEVNSGWSKPLPVEEVAVIARSAMRWDPSPMGGIRIEVVGNVPEKGISDQTVARWQTRCIGGDVRWIHDQDHWIVWDGRRWSRDAATLGFMQARSRAEARSEGIRLSNIGADVEFYTRAASGIVFALETVVRQAAAWIASKQEPEIPVSTDELDVDPYLLNCNNGIVNLRTGGLGPHRRDEMITYLAPTDYDPSADMSEWETFVLWCCDDDTEQARWLQIALGQSLIGKQDEHVLLFLYGTGGNGKTQLTDAIMHTIGDYGLESSADLITARGKSQIHTEATASLRGKRFVVCPEPDRNVHWNSERAKSLTGGDIIRARHLYGREFSFRPVLTMVVHGNYQPEVRDHSDGFRRRIKLVPFSNQVTPNERVTELGRKLAGPGVLRWLVEGAVAYASVEALPPSQKISAATTAYLDEQNHMKRWLAEWCVADSEYAAAIGDMYSTYQFWCRQEGIQYVETKQALSAFLAGMGYKPVMRRIKGRNTRMYAGLRLIEMTIDNLDLT